MAQINIKKLNQKMLKFSVLMTIYKNENPKFLDISFKSIWDDQVLKPNQIIIVLDGSIPNRLKNVVNKWKEKTESIMQIHELEKNIGLGDALGYGINFCTHEFVARMDTDDISMPNRFYRQMKYLQNNKDIDILGSSAIEFIEDTQSIRGVRRVPTNHNDIVNSSKYRNPFNHPSVIYRKEKVLQAGGPKKFTDFDDYFLWIRMININAKCANIYEPLIYMRANENQAKRRGGLAYLKNELSFFKYLLKSKNINYFEFFVNILIRIPIRLIPSRLRYYLYKFLRK